MTVFFCQHTYSQDPHFSQYFSSPMTLNPANTGNFDGPARLAMNFRNQWQGVGQPYITGTASFDTELFKKKAGAGNKIAIGLLGLYDRTTGGKLTSNYFSASLGYHLWTDNEHTSKISIGFQGSMASRRLDFTKISFADQFTSFGFDLNLPSNQNFQTGNISYADINTGLMFSKAKEEGSFYIGTSVYHLTRPNESFLGSEVNRVPMRLTFHSGGTVNLGEKSSLMGSAMYMTQGSVPEAVLGLAYGKRISNQFNDIDIFIGGWLRNKDAIIPYMGYIYNNMQLGISYDINTSGLSASGSRNRSFEISMIYHFVDKSAYKNLVPWY